MVGLDALEAEIGALAYIGLTGSGEGGETREVDLSELSVAETRAELIELLARYEDPATPYPSRLRPAFLAFDGDYDRLARRGEWPETGETPA